MMEMNLISREELAEMLEQGDDFKLVMTMNDWAFRTKRIPGSIMIDDPVIGAALLSPEDEIIVYCSGDLCAASKFAYMMLKENGYKNVRRYAGGVADWEQHGLPLEGEWAVQKSA